MEATGLLMLLSQYITIRGLPLSLCRCLAALPAKIVCVQQSHVGSGVTRLDSARSKQVWPPCSSLRSLGSMVSSPGK